MFFHAAKLIYRFSSERRASGAIMKTAALTRAHRTTLPCCWGAAACFNVSPGKEAVPLSLGQSACRLSMCLSGVFKASKERSHLLLSVFHSRSVHFTSTPPVEYVVLSPA